MNQMERKNRARRIRRNLAVVLPAVGIIALGGCIRSVCGSWAEMMSVGIFPRKPDGAGGRQPSRDGAGRRRDGHGAGFRP